MGDVSLPKDTLNLAGYAISLWCIESEIQIRRGDYVTYSSDVIVILEYTKTTD